MQEIERKVRQAQRRLLTQRFLQLLPWCLLVTMIPALAAVVAAKVWPVTTDGREWAWQWLGGAAGVGLIAALLMTWWRRTRLLEAAIEVDRRFQLKERISSSLILEPPARQSDVGRALIHDAERLAGRVDVRDRFPIRPSWHGLLPLLTAAATILVAIGIQDAQQRKAEGAARDQRQTQQEIKKSIDELRKRLAKRNQDARKNGLQDANKLFDLLKQELNQMRQEGKIDYKKALVKINDLAKELEKRKEKLGGVGAVKKQFEQLSKLDNGPAKKIAKALQAGDMKQARKEIDKLRKKLEQGKLSKQQKQQLAKQLKKLSQELQQMKKRYDEAKKALQKEIERKKQQGDFAAVNQLQKKLDQLQKQKKQMEQLGKMARQAKKAQEALQQGNPKEASQAMNQLGKALSQMQQDAEELQSLSEALDELEDAKEAISEAGEGQGQGQSKPSDQFSDQPGSGLGAGTGAGARAEKKTGTSFYKSRVRGKMGKGEAVRSGELGGANRKGKSLAEAQRAIENAAKEEAGPIVNERLPRLEQRHATEYFKRLRQGK